MGWFPKQGARSRWPITAKVLRVGSKGARVKALQSLLADLGLYHQDPDGVFGYLTEDAVQALQRRFGLRVDWIAGPMVHRLLHHPITSQGLDFHWLLGSLPEPEPRLYPLDFGEEKALTALTYRWWPLDGENSGPRAPSELVTKVAEAYGARLLPTIGLPSPLAQEEDSQANLVEALAQRETYPRLRRAIADQCKRDDICGFLLRIGQVPPALNSRVIRLLRFAAGEAHKHKKLLFLVAPHWSQPRKGAWGLDWQGLGELVHYIVLEVPPPESPASLLSLEELTGALQRWLRVVPAWQLIQHLPMGGILGGGQRVSYNEVRTLAYRSQAMVTRDPIHHSLTFSYREGEELVEAWYENNETIKGKLAVIRRAKLAGIYLSPLGYEANGIWPLLKEEMSIGQY